MCNVNFAIPEIYGDSLSYYEVLRELIEAMNVMIDNYDTIPEQIADAVKNLDAAQLFSAVLDQLIDTIATDNTKSENAVKEYKKHDLLYATFNETVNLYEALIDFTTGTGTELIIGTNIREVNISELFIELRELIDNEAQAREQADTALQNAINAEKSAREQADTTLQQSFNTEVSAREQADIALQNAINTEKSAREQADTTLQQNINAETSARVQADTTLQQNINAETSARVQADNNKVNKSDVLNLEEIRSTTDLTGKIGNAEALKKLIIKERVDRNVRTDSAGKYYPGLKTSELFILSAKASDYVVDVSITSDGNNYYFIVKTAEGSIVRETNIPAIIENYVER